MYRYKIIPGNKEEKRYGNGDIEEISLSSDLLYIDGLLPFEGVYLGDRYFQYIYSPQGSIVDGSQLVSSTKSPYQRCGDNRQQKG